MAVPETSFPKTREVQKCFLGLSADGGKKLTPDSRLEHSAAGSPGLFRTRPRPSRPGLWHACGCRLASKPRSLDAAKSSTENHSPQCEAVGRLFAVTARSEGCPDSAENLDHGVTVCHPKCFLHIRSNAPRCLNLRAISDSSILIAADLLLSFRCSPLRLALSLGGNKGFLSSPFLEEFIDNIKWRHLSNSAIQQYFVITEISLFTINPLILAFCWIDVAVTLGLESEDLSSE